MADKSGIFSLINEKNFNYKNLQDKDGDLYTYKIEKIFNYENYLFVLFSKLYLEDKIEEGDSNKRNHLYLITINKNGQKITSINGKDVESKELYEFINCFNSDDLTNDKGIVKIADLKSGKYKNIVFISNEAFNITITEMTGDSKEANYWARIYRKLENEEFISFYKIDKNNKEKGYFINKTLLNNSNEYDQFISLYNERSYDQEIRLGFGRVASNFSNTNNTTNLNYEEENNKKLFAANKKYLYNYEYYFDRNILGDGYAWKNFYFNQRYRDTNDKTKINQTNPYKTFPFQEKNYFSGKGFIAEDDSRSYYYKENSYITDTFFSIKIDDNYLESYFIDKDNLNIWNNLFNYTYKDDINDNFYYYDSFNHMYYFDTSIFYNNNNKIIAKNFYYSEYYNYLKLYSLYFKGENFSLTKIYTHSTEKLQIEKDNNNYFHIFDKWNNGNLTFVNMIDLSINNIYKEFNIDEKYKLINMIIVDKNYYDIIKNNLTDFNKEINKTIYGNNNINENNDIIEENVYNLILTVEVEGEEKYPMDMNTFIIKKDNKEVFRLVNRFSDNLLFSQNINRLPILYEEDNKYYLNRYNNIYKYNENISYWKDVDNDFSNFLSINNTNIERVVFNNKEYYDSASYGIYIDSYGTIKKTDKENGFITDINYINIDNNETTVWTRNCNFYDVESDYNDSPEKIGDNYNKFWKNDILHPYIYNKDNNNAKEKIYEDERIFTVNNLFDNLKKYKDNEIQGYNTLYDKMVQKFNELINNKTYIVGVTIPKNIGNITKNYNDKSISSKTLDKDMNLNLMILPKGEKLDKYNFSKLFRILYYTPFESYIVPVDNLNDLPWISTSNRPVRFFDKTVLYKPETYLPHIQLCNVINIDYTEELFDTNGHIDQNNNFFLETLKNNLNINFNKYEIENLKEYDKDYLSNNFYYLNSNSIWSYNNKKSSIPLGFKVNNFGGQGYNVYYSYNPWIVDRLIKTKIDENYIDYDYNDNYFAIYNYQPVMLDFDYILNYETNSTGLNDLQYIVEAITSILDKLSNDTNNSKEILYNLIKNNNVALRINLNLNNILTFKLKVRDILKIRYSDSDGDIDVLPIKVENTSFEGFVNSKEYEKPIEINYKEVNYHISYKKIIYKPTLNNNIYAPNNISDVTYIEEKFYKNYNENPKLNLKWEKINDELYKVDFPRDSENNNCLYKFIGDIIYDNLFLSNEIMSYSNFFDVSPEENDNDKIHYHESYHLVGNDTFFLHIPFIHCKHNVIMDEIFNLNFDSYNEGTFYYNEVEVNENYNSLASISNILIDENNSNKNFNFTEIKNIESYNMDRQDGHYISYDFHDLTYDNCNIDDIFNKYHYNIDTYQLTIRPKLNNNLTYDNNFEEKVIEISNNEKNNINYSNKILLKDFIEKLLNTGSFETPSSFKENINIKDSFYHSLVGLEQTSNIFCLCVRYNSILSNFSLELADDPNWHSFFTVNDYAYLPMKDISNERYVLLTDDNDEDPNKKVNRQISILKNNEIIEFNIDNFINKNSNNFDDCIKSYKFLNDSLELIMPFKNEFYYNNFKRLLAGNEVGPERVYALSFNAENFTNINVKSHITNKENIFGESYIDILNVLNNKTPFYKLNTEHYDNKYEIKYKFYAYSINDKIIITKNMSSNNSKDGFSEILCVLKFSDDIITCGDNNYIMVINKNHIYEDNQYKYSCMILDYDNIVNLLYNNLDHQIDDNLKKYKIQSEIKLNQKYLSFDETLIEETSIINENKSENYDLINQTVITKNLLNINYAKLYNIYESDEKNKNEKYRLFIAINGRILVSNDLITILKNKNTTISLNEDEEIINLVDFYTIKGTVNNIYIESVDVDSNNLMCIASDRDELYLFENLFKSNSAYFKNKYIDYDLKNNLKSNCLKYIYNFNNRPLEKNQIKYNTDNRNEYFRKTFIPTILSIGSSVDDITICDKYINTLNTEFIKNSDSNEVKMVNSIKYFKLLDDLSLDDVIPDDNINENESYIKLETFKVNKDNKLINDDNCNDKYSILNLRTQIDNKDISEDNRYFILDYQLVDNNGNKLDNYYFDNNEKYCLTNNKLIFEMNKIYKNIYIYLPQKEVISNLDTGYVKNRYNNLQEVIERSFPLNLSTNLNEYITFNKLINSVIANSNDEIRSNEGISKNAKNVYTLPAKIKYSLEDNYFENEKITYYIENLPSRLTFRDFFICTIKNPNIENPLNRLYFRWRYIGDKESFNNYEGYEYYLLSFTTSNTINPKNLIDDKNYDSKYAELLFYVSYLLHDYVENIYDCNNRSGMDFTFSKIDFSKDFKWAHVNIPKGKNNCKLFNVIVRHKINSTNKYCMEWIEDIIYEPNVEYSINIELDKLRNVEIPYEKVKISEAEYFNFLEHTEKVLKSKYKKGNFNYYIESAYQPSMNIAEYNNFRLLCECKYLAEDRKPSFENVITNYNKYQELRKSFNIGDYIKIYKENNDEIEIDCYWIYDNNSSKYGLTSLTQEEFNNLYGNYDINLILTSTLVQKYNTTDINNLKKTIMKNVYENMIFITDHDYCFYKESNEEKTLIPNKILNLKYDYIEEVINPNYIYESSDSQKENKFNLKYLNNSIENNIFYEFINYKYGFTSYEEYDNFIWSLILDEEDILNFKLNNNDGSFEIKDEKEIDRWWITNNEPKNDNEKIKLWEDPIYRNNWIKENYLPINNTLYDKDVKLYINETYNNGFKYNTYSKDFGLINLTEDISDNSLYSIEKRLMPSVYIDGMKLFNEIYYFKDSLNNVQNIFLSLANIKNYFANTEEFPFYSSLLNNASKAVSEYYKLYEQYENGKISNKPEFPTIDLRDILSNIEVNTNFGLVSEQEKLVASIKVGNIDEVNNTRATVIALNNQGAYYVNSIDRTNPNDDLIINT